MTTYTTFGSAVSLQFSNIDLFTTTNHVTLSGGSLTATATADTTSGFGQGATAAHGKTSGKWYFEVTINTMTGLANGSTVSAIGIRTVGSIYWESQGFDAMLKDANLNTFTINGSNYGGSPGRLVSGDVVGVAVDLNNNKIWIRRNGGNWNGDILANQNPATNVGGGDISGFAPGLGVFPFVLLQSNTDNMTANFGASAFGTAAPSGFTGWTAVSDNMVIDPDSANYHADTNVTSATINCTTAGADRILVVCVMVEKLTTVPTISSVSGGSLTWTRRESFHFNVGSVDNYMEIWWAHPTTALVPTAITVTFSSGIGNASTTFLSFACTGADLTTPFDTNVSLPATIDNASSGSTSLSGVSTTATVTFMFGFWGSAGTGPPAAGTGFSQLIKRINTQGQFDANVMLQGAIFSSAQSSITVTTGSFSAQQWGFVVDALKLAAGSGPAPRRNRQLVLY